MREFQIRCWLQDRLALLAEELELLEQRSQSLMRDNTITGALIDAARVRANALGALLASGGPNAVDGDRGRPRGPAAGTRLTQTA
jgi:hypothetical protein